MRLKAIAIKCLDIAVLLSPPLLVAVKPTAMLATSESPLSLAAQVLLVAAVFAGPGLALLPITGRWMPPSISGKAATIVIHSIFVSAFLPWTLYFIGVYTRTAGMVVAALLYASLAFGLARFPWRGATLRVLDQFGRMTLADKAGIALCSCMFVVTTAQSLEPFAAWDAVVSWNKWGADMAVRNALGKYVMGGYPQLMPSLYSIFYKVFPDSAAGSISDTQYILHFMNGLFNWLAVPGALLLCRRLRASFLVFMAVFFANSLFLKWFASGYVDTATTALFLCTAGICAEWSADRSSERISRAFIVIMPAAATLCLIKGQGYVLAIFIALFTWWWSRSWSIRTSAPAITALACGFLFVLPFFIHQNITWNSGAAETSLLLHSMPMKSGHPDLFVRTWTRAFELVHEASSAYSIPFASEPRWHAVFCSALLAAGFALSLRKRDCIPVAFAAAACGAIWFWKSSYDWRNAHQVAAMAAACIAAGLTADFGTRRGRIVSSTITFAVALLLCGNILAFAAASAPFSLPSHWRLASAQRSSALYGPQFDMLRSSPLAANATHIFSQDVFVWALGEKAVYGWHPLVASATAHPHDVATVSRSAPASFMAGNAESPAFEPISGFRGQRIEMAAPSYTSIPAAISMEGSKSAPQQLPATISEPGTYLLSFNGLQASGGDVLMFRIDCPVNGAADVKAVVGREWNALTSYRGICDFVQHGGSLRALLWLDRVTPGDRIATIPPIALVKIGATPITIEGASIMTIRHDAAATTEDTVK